MPSTVQISLKPLRSQFNLFNNMYGTTNKQYVAWYGGF